MRGEAAPIREPRAHGLVTRPRLLSATAVVVLVALAVPAGVVALPSTAGAVTVGAALITKPGTLTALKGGGSATPYGVALPANASCPGDTAHDGYLVYSYLVPLGALPTDVSFKTGLPSRWSGYFTTSSYFGAVNTAEGSGQIVGIPTSFTWTRLTPHELFPGGAHTATREGGIACATSHGVVTDYWNSQIVFTADQSDPGGFTWKVVGQDSLPTSTDLGLWLGIALLVIASAAATYAIVLRRRVKAELASESVGDSADQVPADGTSHPDPEPQPAGRSQS
jgi:hypothetical protein